MTWTALLDANVLYSITLTDALLEVADTGLYRPTWSARIVDEAARNLKHRTQAKSHFAVDRRFSAMERVFPDAGVLDYESLESAMCCHEGDRHVMAAAVRARADVIVTDNLRHFPVECLGRFDLDAQSADEFLVHNYHVRSDLVFARLSAKVASYTNPSMSVADFARRLDAAGAPAFADVLRGHAGPGGYA